VTRFDIYAARKTREAEDSAVSSLVTIEEGALAAVLPTIGNDWTRRHYDGGFHLIQPFADRAAISLVFVQSRDGNTGADDPASLGGGATDAHLIYEGLSRVAADAVLSGSKTIADADVFFSVWHPALVDLRCSLNLSRHPAQVVLTSEGRLDLDRSLLFNVPEARVLVITGAEGRARLAIAAARRPWLTFVPTDEVGLPGAISTLRDEHGLRRISAVGGRRTASSLIDAGLIQDLCLTTTAREGGEPNTPFYVGRQTLSTKVIVRKRSESRDDAILFEHLVLV
jgi:riboflavin biosynthesis pyrimidine reductase